MASPDSAVARGFAANLRAVRQERLITQEELSHAAGLHRTEVGLLENGRRIPRLDTLLRLAAALEVEPVELLRGVHVQIPGRIEVRAMAPERTDAEAALESGLLTLILKRRPEHLTAEALMEEAGPAAAGVPGGGDALRRGLDRLRRAELVRDRAGVIEPTLATLHLAQLLL